jgi:Lipase (class 3)
MSEPFSSGDAVRYGHFVGAAYAMFDAAGSSLTPPPSGIPAGWELAAWIQMSDFAFGNVEPKFYGLIAQSQADPTQFVVAIRGTEGAIEWWDDADIASTEFKQVPNAGHVSAGFDRIYSTLKVVDRDSGEMKLPQPAALSGSFGDQVAALIQRAGRRQSGALKAFDLTMPRVVVTGHSLGAVLCTLYVIENDAKKLLANPTICTFASPRVGNATFASAYNNLGLTSWRIVNAPDLVPNIPPDIFGYVHVDTEYLFSSAGKVRSTLGCAHALSTYLSLLDPALKPDADCQPTASDVPMANPT